MSCMPRTECSALGPVLRRKEQQQIQEDTVLCKQVAKAEIYS